MPAKNPKNKPAAKKPTPIHYTKLTTAADLVALSAGPVIVERVVLRDGKPFGFTLTGRRLTPAEVRQVSVLLSLAMPPELPRANVNEEPKYDFRNPDYIKQKAEFEAEARAFALVSAFPFFGDAFRAKGIPNAGSKQMLEFLDGLGVEDDILTEAYEQLTKTVVGVDWSRVSFSSGSRSQKS